MEFNNDFLICAWTLGSHQPRWKTPNTCQLKKREFQQLKLASDLTGISPWVLGIIEILEANFLHNTEREGGMANVSHEAYVYIILYFGVLIRLSLYHQPLCLIAEYPAADYWLQNVCKLSADCISQCGKKSFPWVAGPVSPCSMRWCHGRRSPSLFMSTALWSLVEIN